MTERRSQSFWDFVDETRDNLRENIKDILWGGAGTALVSGAFAWHIVESKFPGEGLFICSSTFFLLVGGVGVTLLVKRNGSLTPNRLTTLIQSFRENGIDIVDVQEFDDDIEPPEFTETVEPIASVDAYAEQFETMSLRDICLRVKSVPHSIVLGSTGAGKSTFVHAIGVHLAKADKTKVYLIDPDYAEGSWPGAHVVGGADNWEEIDDFLDYVVGEVNARRQMYHIGVRDFPEMYIFIDELKSVFENCEDGIDIVEDILRRGRKIKLHVIAGSQDMQVATLNIQGRGKIRDNFGIVFELSNVNDVRRFKMKFTENPRLNSEWGTPTLRPIDDYIETISYEEGLRRISGARGGSNSGSNNSGSSGSSGSSGFTRPVLERNEEHSRNVNKSEPPEPPFDFPIYIMGQRPLEDHEYASIVASYFTQYVQSGVPSISQACRDVFGGKNGERFAVVKEIFEDIAM